MRTIILLLLTLILAVPAGASNRMLTAEFEVNAPIEKAWSQSFLRTGKNIWGQHSSARR
jgi:hypothetical protein